MESVERLPETKPRAGVRVVPKLREPKHPLPLGERARVLYRKYL